MNVLLIWMQQECSAFASAENKLLYFNTILIIHAAWLTQALWRHNVIFQLKYALAMLLNANTNAIKTTVNDYPYGNQKSKTANNNNDSDNHPVLIVINSVSSIYQTLFRCKSKKKFSQASACLIDPLFVNSAQSVSMIVLTHVVFHSVKPFRIRMNAVPSSLISPFNVARRAARTLDW